MSSGKAGVGEPGGGGACTRPLDGELSVRSSFVDEIGFRLDRFQIEALDALDAGESVLVAAPTGSGKTVVADYAVFRALSLGAKAFYTTPLKALSNQKHAQLAGRLGSQRVGLLTGDVSRNPDARVVVMTTEVLRNMMFARSSSLDGLGVVVLDEVHYLQDPYRGSVWEEILILAERSVAMVCLSATIGNVEELGGWIRSIRGPIRVVIEKSRPVVLTHYLAIAKRSTGQVGLVKVLNGANLGSEASRLDQRLDREAFRRHRTMVSPRRVELLEELSAYGMLPAIVFIFSRAACDAAALQCASDGLVLTSPAERTELRRRLEMHTAGLGDDDLDALGYGRWSTILDTGVASHHAGLVPAFREAVEDCFTDGLLKVVYATETLSLGMNMPARTVVIERLTKMSDAGRGAITAAEYAQLTGRAGRRGIDSQGNAVVVWAPGVRLGHLARLAVAPPGDLRSSFRPSYNLAVNLVRRYPRERAHEVIDRSFAQYRDARSRRVLSGRMDRITELLEAWGYVDVSAWRLSAKGEMLSRIYHESDLLLAECVAGGLLDDLDPASLAAVVSSLTFAARPGRDRSAARLVPHVAKRIDAVRDVAMRQAAAEKALRLPRSRGVDPGLADAAYRWLHSEPLKKVLDHSGLAPGDFVRNMNQLGDLLRQIALLAAPGAPARQPMGRQPDRQPPGSPLPSVGRLSESASSAARRLHRGVLVAGGGRSATLEGPSI